MSGQIVGIAKRWNEPKGFGFITPQGGQQSDDIFCHRTNITDGDCLVEGSTVYYDVDFDEGRGKFRAVQVRGGAQKGQGKGNGAAPRGGAPAYGYAQPAYRPPYGAPAYANGMYGPPQGAPFGQYGAMGMPMSPQMPMGYGFDQGPGPMGMPMDPMFQPGFDQMAPMPGFQPQMAPQAPMVAPMLPQMPMQPMQGSPQMMAMQPMSQPNPNPQPQGGRKGRRG